MRLSFKKSPIKFMLRGFVATTKEMGRIRVYRNTLFLTEVSKMSVELKQNLKDLQQKLVSLRSYL
jgi:hypothetical protein